jgi:small subunit ribosomal protein S17
LERNNRKEKIGTVISDKMDKTVVVVVETMMTHPKYKKVIRRKNNFKAHDENNECGVGDTVEIMESRPLSREKRWRVSRVVEKAK